MTILGTLQEYGEALPGLRAARRAGRLVPFVGAGISRPHCRSWPDFIDALYKGFGETPAIRWDSANSEDLYRAADRVAAWLRLRPLDERGKLLRAALLDPAAKGLPAQALALSSFAWPLIITTNYDAVLPESYRRHIERSIRILGRSAPDCAEVVRALDALDGVHVRGRPKVLGWTAPRHRVPKLGL
jgi:hypothetical protein